MLDRLRDLDSSFVRMTDTFIFHSLSILGREDTGYELRLSPYQMFESELYRIWAPRDGRKLEEISDEYDLYTTKWIHRHACWLHELIEIREESTWKHRYLIDDEDRCLLESFRYIFSWDDRIDVFITEDFSYPETTPRMDRHTSYVGRSDTRRSSDRYTDAVLMTVTDKSVHEIGLSAPCGTGQEYILPHGQYVECLILIHADECMKNGEKDKGKNNQILFNYIFI